MIRIRLHCVGLAFAVGVDEFGGDEVVVGYGVRVGEGERVTEDSFNGAPDLWEGWRVLFVYGRRVRGLTLMI